MIREAVDRFQIPFGESDTTDTQREHFVDHLHGATVGGERGSSSREGSALDQKGKEGDPGSF
jgi:hypothetical protein